MQLRSTAPAPKSLATLALCSIGALLLPMLPLQAANSLSAASPAPKAFIQETPESRISEAYVESLRLCSLRTDVAGPVTEMLVKVGERVKAGQVLARIGASEITAPYDAIVSATLAKVGEMAPAGRRIVTVYDPARMRVVASVPRSRLRELNLDEPVQIDVADLGQRMTAQKVLVISPGDKPMEMAKLYLEMGDAAGLQPGQVARATFALSGWQVLRP